MKGLTLFLFVSLLLTGGFPIIVTSALQNPRTFSSYGTIIYERDTSLKVFRAQEVNELPQAQRTAEIITENLDLVRAWDYRGELVQQIHQLNPDVKCLLYRNVRSIKDYSDEWQMALDKDWILKDSEGNLVHSNIWSTSYMADIGNTEYQKWVANWIKENLDQYGFDGVFSDNGFSANSGTWYGVTGQPINPRTGNFWTSNEVIEAWVSFHHEIKQAIGSKLNIANGIFEGSWFWGDQTKWIDLLSNCEVDGFMSEGLFNWGLTEGGIEGTYYTEEKWKKSVDFVVWIQENFLNQAEKLFLPHGRCSVDQIPSDCTTEQMATFVFSSLLLAINKSQNYLSLQDAILLDEVQNLFKVDLGVPKGNYYLIDGTHIYARDFTKVKVLVNPTDQSYLVNLGGDYGTLEGQILSSINIKPHTGFILRVI